MSNKFLVAYTVASVHGSKNQDIQYTQKFAGSHLQKDKYMGNQGFYSLEGLPLSKRDLALLPRNETILLHTHAQRQDKDLERLLRTANRKHGETFLLPKRSATIGSPIYIMPIDHDGHFMATNYKLTTSSDPLHITKNFGVEKPLEFRGGRKKKHPDIITWLVGAPRHYSLPTRINSAPNVHKKKKK